MIVIVLPVAAVRRVGVRIIQIIGVVLIDQRRSNSERVTHVIGVVNANRFVHGIVDDLEKVRVVWQLVELCGCIANDRNSWDQ